MSSSIAYLQKEDKYDAYTSLVVHHDRGSKVSLIGPFTILEHMFNSNPRFQLVLISLKVNYFFQYVN